MTDVEKLLQIIYPKKKKKVKKFKYNSNQMLTKSVISKRVADFEFHLIVVACFFFPLFFPLQTKKKKKDYDWAAT